MARGSTLPRRSTPTNAATRTTSDRTAVSWNRNGPVAATRLYVREPPPSDRVARGKNRRPPSRLSTNSRTATTTSAAVRFPARAAGLVLSIGSAALYRVAPPSRPNRRRASRARLVFWPTSPHPDHGFATRRAGSIAAACGLFSPGFPRGQRHRNKNPALRPGSGRLGLDGTYAGYLISYPSVGRGMVIFRYLNGTAW